MDKAKVSIIIRTKNEEEWIGHCLEMVFNQEQVDYEVILADNNSQDHTLEIASRYPIKKIVKIDHYLPGKALNNGIQFSQSEFIVCLSAHCIPKTKKWLHNLLINFGDDKIAGVYGRQIPLSFSSPQDVRDLLIIFGLDKRVQIKDSFFHNGNSAIRKDVLEKYPFDETVSNVEDRLWGKAVIEKGYQLIYEPEAIVYHHHGIHHQQNEKRAKSTFAVLDNVAEFSTSDSLPQLMKPENRNVSAIVPVLGGLPTISNFSYLSNVFEEIKLSKFIKSVYVLTTDKEVVSLSQKFNFNVFDRPKEINSSNVDLEQVLQWGFAQIEADNIFPDVILYVNPLYTFRPLGLFDELIADLCYKGLETVFAGYVDYQNFWAYDNDKGYHEVGEGLLHRSKKHPIYRELLGLGCVSLAKVIRRGRLIGDKVGIIPLEDIKYILKTSDESSKSLIESIYFQEAKKNG